MAVGRRQLRIDAEQLETHIQTLGAIGALPEGGLYRPVYGQSWVDAMALLERWFAQAGLEVRHDAVGSLFGRATGRDAEDGVVLTGSHVDTVLRGGRYDGALGIHASLAALRSLLDAFGRPRRSIEVVALCEEEGSRFHCTFWGTRAMLGLIAPDEPDALRDADGITIGAAMAQVGFDPAAIPSARRSDLAAFLELHIEQGPVLASAGLDLGIPHTITGQRQLAVTIHGRQDHAGTTPMDMRLDPLVAAARMIERITMAADSMGRPAVATIGRIEARPGAVNVVADSVRFTIDTRHSDALQRLALIEQIEAAIGEVAAAAGVKVSIERLIELEPVPLDGEVRSLLTSAARDEGLRYLEMPSGAGHDSQVMAQHLPTGMIFVPSREGRSHSPEEFTPIDQVVPGVRVLARALYELAYR